MSYSEIHILLHISALCQRGCYFLFVIAENESELKFKFSLNPTQLCHRAAGELGGSSPSLWWSSFWGSRPPASIKPWLNQHSLLGDRGRAAPITRRSGQTWVTRSANVNSSESAALLLDWSTSRVSLSLSPSQQRFLSFTLKRHVPCWLDSAIWRNISEIWLSSLAPLSLLLMLAHIFSRNRQKKLQQLLLQPDAEARRTLWQMIHAAWPPERGCWLVVGSQWPREIVMRCGHTHTPLQGRTTEYAALSCLRLLLLHGYRAGNSSELWQHHPLAQTSSFESCHREAMFGSGEREWQIRHPSTGAFPN